MHRNSRSVDIAIPVYDAKSLTLRCIDSVIDNLADNPSTGDVVVIYDAGPDDTLLTALQAKADAKEIILLINAENLGFVRTANRGMTYSDSRDILLLNSDTEVAGDWLERLARVAYSADDVGTVTPFSNNAEICSWPRFCQDNELPAGHTVSEIDRAFAPLADRSVELPTGVGFCMYVRRDCVERTGLFNDAMFGAGYGEENDFCRRAAAQGLKNLLACGVFVFHQGGASFGSQKQARLERALEILHRLHPDYPALVAAHIQQDPARRWRFVAELALTRNTGRPFILHISHGIGGGTDKHVVELCRSREPEANHGMLVPQEKSMRLVFPGILSDGLFEFPDTALPDLQQLLQTLNLQRIHIHHVKGWEQRIGSLLQTLDKPYDVTLHDYYFIHPNPALADKHGMFCEDPVSRDQLCSEAVPLPAGYLNINQWQQQWRPMLRQAQRIIAPSRACAAIFHEAYPELQVITGFHPDYSGNYPAVTLPALQPGEPLRVVVLGALSIIKGANVLEKTALLASASNAPLKFTLIGYAYKTLNPAISTTGPYTDAQLPALIAAARPHVIWFPCSWPETYSYTLSCALAAGLPVLCSDIGALAERTHNRPGSWLAGWRSTPEQWLDRLLQLRDSYTQEDQQLSWQQQPQSDFDYANDYLVAPVVDDRHSAVQTATPDWEDLTRYWIPELPQPRKLHHRLFRILLWMQIHPWFGRVADLIPLAMRRSIKRRLTTRPLHE